jgi:hypothetical protein
VVGGFVEEQHVGAGKQDAGQLHPASFAAGQHAERQLEAVGAEAEPGGEGARLAVGAVATGRPEALLGARVAGDVALVGGLLHRQAQLLEAHELLVDAATAEDVGDRGAAVEDAGDARVLRQVTEPALAHDAAADRLGGAAEHPEQAGLAGPVAADDADLVARHQREGRVLHHEAATHLHRQPTDLQHGCLR